MEYETMKALFARKAAVVAIWILCAVFLMRPSPAHAAAPVSFSSASNTITIADSHTVCNISTLYSELVKLYGEVEVQANILNEISPRIWLAKGAISVPSPGNFVISDADVSELRVGGHGGTNKAYALYGYIGLKNVRAAGWNVAEDRYSDRERSSICLLYCEASGVTLTGFTSVLFGSIYGQKIENLAYFDLTLDRTREGMIFQNADHITVDQVLITVDNDIDTPAVSGDTLASGGILASRMDNSTLSNIRVLNVSADYHECTGAYGLQLNGDNNTIHDVDIENASYSGVLIGGSDFSVYNVTVVGATHNGFEINAGSTVATLLNITVKDSHMHNFFQVGAAEKGITTGNITWENLTSVNPGSYAMTITEGSYNTIVKNSVFEGIAGISNSKGITMLNVSADGRSPYHYGFVTYDYESNWYQPGVFPYNENHTYIDCLVQNADVAEYQIRNNSHNIRIVNQAVSKVYYYDTDNNTSDAQAIHNSDYTKYYYVDVAVVDLDSKPIPNAQVRFENEKNASFPSVDGWGRDRTGFTTGANGHVPLPNSDRANSPAIAEFHTELTPDGNVNQSFTHKITAEAYGVFASVFSVAPDASWHRVDPNTYAHTITIVLPFRLSVLQQAGFHPYPNPYVEGKNANGKITFRNVPAGATIRIYNTSANRIKTLQESAGKAEWDVRDAGSGVYGYLLTASGRKITGKLSIIK